MAVRVAQSRFLSIKKAHLIESSIAKKPRFPTFKLQKCAVCSPNYLNIVFPSKSAILRVIYNYIIWISGKQSKVYEIKGIRILRGILSGIKVLFVCGKWKRFFPPIRPEKVLHYNAKLCFQLMARQRDAKKIYGQQCFAFTNRERKFQFRKFALRSYLLNCFSSTCYCWLAVSVY